MSDEEAKDNRYFPSEDEFKLLINSLQTYFNQPERSQQRAAIVNSVAEQLSAQSGHWNPKNVRLWFNNNKKSYFNHGVVSSNVKRFDSHKEILEELLAKKHCNISGLSKSTSHLPKLGDNCVVHLPHMYLPISPVSETIIPNNISFETSISRIQETERCTLVNAAKQLAITDMICPIASEQTKSTSYQEDSVISFHHIHSGLLLPNGRYVVAAVAPDMNGHYLYIEGQKNPILLTKPVTSLAYCPTTNLVWCKSSHCITSYQLDNLTEGPTTTLTFTCPHTASIAMWNKSISLTQRNRVLLYHVKEGSLKFTTCFNTRLPEINATQHVADFLAVASNDHHAIHVYSENGAVFSRFLGHLSGITALAGYDSNCLFSASTDQTMKLWDLRDDKPCQEILHNHGVVTALSINNTPYLTSGGTDNNVRQWDVRMATNSLVKKVKPSYPCAVSSDATTISVLTTENTEQRFFNILSQHSIQPIEEELGEMNKFVRYSITS